MEKTEPITEEMEDPEHPEGINGKNLSKECRTEARKRLRTLHRAGVKHLMTEVKWNPGN